MGEEIINVGGYRSTLIMLEFKSKLEVQTPIAEPDSYVTDLEKAFETSYPDENFIISRTKTGQVLSRFGDDHWDLSPYTEHSRATRIIYFKKVLPDVPESKVILREYKWIMFILIFISNYGRAGFLSVSTICRHSVVVSFIVRYCFLRKITIHNLFCDEGQMRRFFNSPNAEKQTERVLAIIRSIGNVDKNISGFDIIDNATQLFSRRAPRDRSKQTVIIPSRIFSAIISSCHDWLNEFIPVKDRFLELVKKAHDSKAYARSINRQRTNVPGIKILEDDFQRACHSLGLSSYVSRKGIHDLHDISRHLRTIQYTCKLLIHIYTGMRDNEVSSLKYDCFHKETSINGRVYRIVGETTKLVGVRKAARWITSQEIEPAINVVKQISKIIAECMSINDDNHILFLPVSNLAFSPSSKSARSIYQSGFSDIKSSIFSIVIEECDIKELQQISPNVDWLGEPGFQIGSAWPVATHQFRRTLAVYAAQSGLVSLTSLKRQLKQLSKEMALYYAAGSSYSQSIFGNDKTHFSHDYNESKTYGEGLGYIYNLLLSEQTLHGPYGKWLEAHDRKADRTQILAKREETIKRFKRGELAYSETPLGACLSNVACDKKAMRAISACISCDKAVIVESKLEKVMLSQQLLLDTLNENSMEYRMEQEQFIDLKRMHENLRKKK